MLAIPQVELQGGGLRRLSGSVCDVLGGDALQIARSWAAIGFSRIHLIDRDAIAGHHANGNLVDEIARDGTIEVQIDDAADSGDEIDRLVSAGAVRVVLGPRWREEPEWLASTAESYPGLLLVAADVRERRVVTRGWVRSLPMAILDVVADLHGVPLGGLLLTSAAERNRSNLDLGLIEDIADSADVPVIVDGGVHSVSDLRALEHRGVSAVLLGDSLYRGGLDPRAIAMEFSES